MDYLSLQHTCNIGQINESKTNMWKSIPGYSKSMEQIKLLMVQILNPNSCSVFGEKEPRGEMKIWTVSTGSEVRRLVCSRKLGAVICGAELPATSDPRQEAARDLGALIHGVETWYLGAMMYGADLLGLFLYLSFLGVQLWTFLKKRPNCKKLGLAGYLALAYMVIIVNANT